MDEKVRKAVMLTFGLMLGWCAVSAPAEKVRIAFIGNSITLHKAAPRLGWTNEWGMAASGMEKDYVHLVARGIEAMSGRPAELMVRNMSDFERNFSDWNRDAVRDIARFAPDYLVIALGDNVKGLENATAAASFRKAFSELVGSFSADGRRPRTVIRGVFWPDETVDGVMSAVAREFGACFVRADIAGVPGMRATGLFADRGVAGHPGDAGMAEIAGRILAAFSRDRVYPAGAGEVKVLGRPGELFQSSLNRRVFSPHAQGPVYDEAENAFATHWDDSNGHTGWQNEYWGKTMLCYAGALRYTGDRRLKDWCLAKARHFIDTYQWPNGYLSTYANEDLLRKNPESPDYEQHWCFNIWGQKYTLWALIELHQATGDGKCLDAAVKMADHLVAQLKRLDVPIEKTGSWAGISSMTILRPLLELYRLVPKREYLELAEHIVRVTDVREGPKPDVNLIYDALSDRPVVSWFRKPMHLSKAYELLSFFEGLADYHRLTGDLRAFSAVKAFWTHLEREEINPMRSAGYFDHFLYARHHVNGMTELCDVTHWIRLNRELWKLTGETKYLDAIEEAFYNAFLAGVTPDGSWGAHIIRSHGTRHLTAPAQTGMKLHQCCPDNMLRTFYDWADTVADVARDGAWEVNFYSDADIRLPGLSAGLRGNYPVSESFRLGITAERAGRLRLRVPYWAQAVTVDGKALTPSSGRVELAVVPGKTTLEVSLPMPPRVLGSRAPAFEDIDTVTELDTQKPEGYTKRFMSWYTPEMEGLARHTPAATVMRGPLVLAKGRTVGTSRADTFDFETINAHPEWKLSLSPLPRRADNIGVWGAWELKMERNVSGRGVERKAVPVADFWSVSCMDDPGNWFSLWF